MRHMQIVLLAGAVLAAPPGVRPAPADTTPQEKSASHVTPRPPERWWKTDKYRLELKLTAEQSAEIERIVQESWTRMKADKNDLDGAQIDFRQLMERPNASERELLKAAERLEMARYSISKERTMMLVRIHKVLTPEQRAGLDVIAKRHEASRKR
jgi:Spy/CpxP family protein refolding chaperone